MVTFMQKLNASIFLQTSTWSKNHRFIITRISFHFFPSCPESHIFDKSPLQCILRAQHPGPATHVRHPAPTRAAHRRHDRELKRPRRRGSCRRPQVEHEQVQWEFLFVFSVSTNQQCFSHGSFYVFLPDDFQMQVIESCFVLMFFCRYQQLNLKK